MSSTDDDASSVTWLDGDSLEAVPGPKAPVVPPAEPSRPAAPPGLGPRAAVPQAEAPRPAPQPAPALRLVTPPGELARPVAPPAPVAPPPVRHAETLHPIISPGPVPAPPVHPGEVLHPVTPPGHGVGPAPAPGDWPLADAASGDLLRPATPPHALSLGETLRPVTPVSPHGTLLQGVVTPLPTAVVRGLVPGQVVAGRYRVEKWLGAGGSATVYDVTDLQQNQRVALKLLAVPHAEEALVARFRKEVEHARALEHVNILRIFDVGMDGDRHFLTMELLEGTDLRQRLQERRPSLAEALRWLTHAAVALEHAHGRGVLHRDVKPANLFITRTGVLKLMDFGLAKSTHVPGTTAHGAVLGTPEYMAPEQVMGNPPVSPATDLYALGVVAYELFTGQLPFRHSQPVPLMFLHVQQDPVPPRTLCPNLPEPFERVVLKLLQKRPEDRYSGATELRSVLAKLWAHVLPT